MKNEHDTVREKRRCGRGGEHRGGGADPRRLEGADAEEGCRFGFCGGEIGTWLHCGGRGWPNLHSSNADAHTHTDRDRLLPPVFII